MKKSLSIADLSPSRGSRHKRWRVGRGTGSGNGKTAGRGENGQKARSGYSKPLIFEGGQMPAVRRTPKVGFKPPFRVEYKAVNIESLNQFENGTEVTPASLKEKGIIDGRRRVKVLGRGKLEKKLTVKAHAFSDSAKAAIEKAGGVAESLA